MEFLRQIWIQQYKVESLADGTTQIRLRADGNQPPAELRIHSPYDLETRYSEERATAWVGYKAYLTETCDDDTIHLNVETTSAAVPDVNMVNPIHTALAAKDFLPGKHLMDAQFIDADLLVNARRELAVEVWGPIKKDVRWQAQAGQGLGLSEFKINRATQTVTCAQGQSSSAWPEQRNHYDHPIIQVRFKPRVYRACPSQTLCTRSQQGVRYLVLQPPVQHEALQQRREAHKEPEFWKEYAKPSVIEGTISQAVRACDLRRSRHIGFAKTHSQWVATATAINLHRFFEWLTDVPRAQTRTSPFARLAPDLSLAVASWRC